VLRSVRARSRFGTKLDQTALLRSNFADPHVTEQKYATCAASNVRMSGSRIGRTHWRSSQAIRRNLRSHLSIDGGDASVVVEIDEPEVR
jgi:hypothetical protein